jgi:arginase
MFVTDAKHIEIIGAAACWGAKDHFCESGPSVLRNRGLLRELQMQGSEVNWRHLDLPYLPDREANTLPIIASYCEELADAVYDVVSGGAQFAVVGGDHSCAVGTWSGVHRAVSQQGAFGLIWVDAHMDSHTPASSHSGAVHGMPLAALLGYGDARLTRIATPLPKLQPKHVCLVGVRSYEPEEAALLEQLKVRVFYMDEVERRGLDAVFAEALERVQRGTLGFGVSIDMDALDPQDAPGVGSPEPHGLRGDDLVQSLTMVKEVEGLLGIELVEFNPTRDDADRTAKLASQLLLAAL